jgi:type II secretory ATPase GspE/PulE/Tfp pilus assembly ATPase PilB-like protein
VTPESIRALIQVVERRLDDANAVSNLFRDIVTDALDLGATDIEFAYEPRLDANWVVFRVNSLREHRHVMEPQAMRVLITRTKLAGNVPDYALRDKLQEGRLTFPYGNRSIDVRLTSGPIEPGGEELCLRMQDQTRTRTLADLMQHMPEAHERLKTILQATVKMAALIVISGSTGSGKTNTLGALTQSIDRLGRKVEEIHDPVEIFVPYARQAQISPESGRGFEEHLINMLRRDPDIINYGEVRSKQSLEQLLVAIESGHPVLTTVHAPDCAGVVTRLARLIDPEQRKVGLFNLANMLRVVMHQMLFTTVCPACVGRGAAGDVMDEEEHLLLGLAADAQVSLRNHHLDGAPCEMCRNSGIGGRILAAESLLFPQEERHRITLRETFLNEDFVDLVHAPGMTYVPRETVLGRIVLDGHCDPRDVVRELRSR